MEAIVSGLQQLWTSTGIFGFLFPEKLREMWFAIGGDEAIANAGATGIGQLP